MEGESEMENTTFPSESLKEYDVVVILSYYQGKLLLSREKKNPAWEFQGGALEEGEIPSSAARRILYNESGACGFNLHPMCDFIYNEKKGMAFLATVYELGPLSDGEMRERKAFDVLPAKWHYPELSSLLLKYKEEIEE